MSFLARAMQNKASTIYPMLTQVLQRVEGLERENALQKLRISELESQLNSNSKNSSRPPSSGGCRKNPALPKAKRGKQGGQKGHKGKTLCQEIGPGTIIECKLGLCTCGHKFSEQESTTFIKRQAFELPKPTLEVTGYRLHKSVCPECGLKNQGVVPKGVNAPVQYGNNAKAFAVLLNTHYKVPFKKIQLLFGDLFGYSINGPTVYSAGPPCYNQLEQTEGVIKSQVSQADVAHANGSGLRVLGEFFGCMWQQH